MRGAPAMHGDAQPDAVDSRSQTADTSNCCTAPNAAIGADSSNCFRRAQTASKRSVGLHCEWFVPSERHRAAQVEEDDSEVRHRPSVMRASVIGAPTFPMRCAWPGFPGRRRFPNTRMLLQLSRRMAAFARESGSSLHRGDRRCLADEHSASSGWFELSDCLRSISAVFLAYRAFFVAVSCASIPTACARPMTLYEKSPDHCFSAGRSSTQL